jgi:hypothetical protein
MCLPLIAGTSVKVCCSHCSGLTPLSIYREPRRSLKTKQIQLALSEFCTNLRRKSPVAVAMWSWQDRTNLLITARYFDLGSVHHLLSPSEPSEKSMHRRSKEGSCFLSLLGPPSLRHTSVLKYDFEMPPA